jgi:hypothetical protein
MGGGMMRPQERRDPETHICDVAGCTAYSAHTFGFPGGRIKRACLDPAHRDQVRAEWEEAMKVVAVSAAEARKPAQGSLL